MTGRQGIVVQGYGGFYQVLLADGHTVACKPRGRIKLSYNKICTGDRVEISLPQAGEGMIESILPRRNQLTRPHIANVDQAVIVLAWRSPAYDLLLLDNLLLTCRLSGIAPVLVLNKIDLLEAGEEAELASIRAAYCAADCPVLTVSATRAPEMDGLYTALRGKLSVFAGPSGVGKTSLLNRLLPQEQAAVGEVSQRLNRGKHTTRYTRLLPLPGADGGMIADTPGFFVLDTPQELTEQQLPGMYPDFAAYAAAADGCRFDLCLHHREPDCAVRRAAEEGRLDMGRYQRYLRILDQIRTREVKY